MILMILAPLVGVLGAILLSFGAWVIYPCWLHYWRYSVPALVMACIPLLSGNWKIESGEGG